MNSPGELFLDYLKKPFRDASLNVLDEWLPTRKDYKSPSYAFELRDESDQAIAAESRVVGNTQGECPFNIIVIVNDSDVAKKEEAIATAQKILRSLGYRKQVLASGDRIQIKGVDDVRVFRAYRPTEQYGLAMLQGRIKHRVIAGQPA